MPVPSGIGKEEDQRQDVGLDAAGSASMARRVRLAGARPFREALSLTDALRPLRLGVPEATGQLDEDGTADILARTGLLMPCWESRKVSPFRIKVVLEATRGVLFWSAWVRHWVELLRQATRSRVTLSYLIPVADADSGTRRHPFILSPLWPAERGAHPETLGHPGRKRLIFLFTDMLSPLWKEDGPMPALLRDWSRHQTVTILNPLHRDIWIDSAWARADRGFAHCRELGRVRWLNVSGTTVPETSAPVFHLRLTASAVGNWARTVTARAAVGHPSLTWPVLAVPAKPRPIPPAPVPDPLSMAEFQDFVKEAETGLLTPSGLALLRVLTAAPLTPAIMRLVQRSIYPSMGHEQLSEVHRSGLLYRLPGQPESKDPDRVHYDFLPVRPPDGTVRENAMRDHFFNQAGWDRVDAVRELVGDFIARQHGLDSWSVEALERAKEQDGDASAEELRPFARVMGHVLGRFGERFEEQAKALTAWGRGDSAAGPAVLPEPKSKEPIDDRPAVLTNSIGMTMLGIPSGTFQDTGAPPGISIPEETLESFRIARTPVTQRQWKAVMGGSVIDQFRKGNAYGAITGTDDDHPMYFITWGEALAFCDRLTRQDQEAGLIRPDQAYSLPRNVQWEYACRAGTNAGVYRQDVSIDDLAWHSGNSERTSHPVRQKLPNAWGLYDCLGNVAEWCAEALDPGTRTICGGSRMTNDYALKSDLREAEFPSRRRGDIGFRPVLAGLAQREALGELPPEVSPPPLADSLKRILRQLRFLIEYPGSGTPEILVRLQRRIERTYDSHCFWAAHDITMGQNWDERLESEWNQADIILVPILNDEEFWSGEVSRSGQYGGWVHLVKALESPDRMIVPLFFDGARIESASLSPALKPLVHRKGVTILSSQFDHDVAKLVEAIALDVLQKSGDGASPISATLSLSLSESSELGANGLSVVQQVAWGMSDGSSDVVGEKTINWLELSRDFDQNKQLPPAFSDQEMLGVKLAEEVLADSIRENLLVHHKAVWEIEHDQRCSTIPFELLAIPKANGEIWRPALEAGMWRRFATEPTRAVRHQSMATGYRVLIIADPLDDLYETRREAAQIRQTLEEAFRSDNLLNVEVKVLLGRTEASLQNVIAEIGSGMYDIVHYAGNANFHPKEPMNSGLLFREGFFTSDQIRRVLLAAERPPTLVIFNGCTCAAAAEAVLAGGVVGFIGPRWIVQDSTATIFATSVYSFLANGLSLGEAVHNARSRLYAAASVDWANYQLFGSPEIRLRWPSALPTVTRSPDLIARDFEVPAASGMKMLCIGAGDFLMGEGREAHPVTLTEDFFIAETPVTQAQYEAVMGTNPSHFKEVGPEAPVEMVSWEDAMAFCARLNQIAEPEDGWQWALPREAQWEYACRAGTTTAFSFGDALNGTQANCDGTDPDGKGVKGPYLKRSSPVRSYGANPWGLYDCHGNVWEWCADQFGAYHVLRGGSWFHPARECRSGTRRRFDPVARFYYTGFRPVFTQKKPAESSVPEPEPTLEAEVKAQARSRPEEYVARDFANGLGMEMICVPPGTFTMGSPAGEEGRESESWMGKETQHQVTLTEPFWIAKTPLTQHIWRTLMGTTVAEQRAQGNSHGDVTGTGDDHPVYFVIWEEALAACDRLSIQERDAGRLPDGYLYTLPTEAQWEYACRAGTAGAFNVDGTSLPNLGWYRDNSGGSTHPVGEKPPNAWGLHDCHGNVWEWCADLYRENLGSNYATDPTFGNQRTLRGGSWVSVLENCYSHSRSAPLHGQRDCNIGFRPVLAPRRQRTDLASLPAELEGVVQPERPDATAAGQFRPVFIEIPAGKFLMGSPKNEKGREPGDAKETQHEVTLTYPFEIADAPVTQAQYQAVAGNNPSRFTESGLNAPVEQVSWQDAIAWCRKMSDVDPQYEYRLPTEAEWEYACRAGTGGPFNVDGEKLENLGWYAGNAGGRTHPVKEKLPNKWGLYDCHGNVVEWCADPYAKDLGFRAVTDPSARPASYSKVVRGGFWEDAAEECRSAFRNRADPDQCHPAIGFRPVRTKRIAEVTEPDPTQNSEVKSEAQNPRRGLFGRLFGGKR